MSDRGTLEQAQQALKSYDECTDRGRCATHKRTRRSELTDLVLRFEVRP